MLDFLFYLIYLIFRMSKKNDIEIIQEFVNKCLHEHLTLQEMGKLVGRTSQWASTLVNGKTKKLRFKTKGLILEKLGKL